MWTRMSDPRPKPKKPDNLVVYYVYLAVACTGVGTALTMGLILFCEYYDIDLLQNLWLLAIPASVALFVNVTLVEIYRHIRGGGHRL